LSKRNSRFSETLFTGYLRPYFASGPIPTSLIMSPVHLLRPRRFQGHPRGLRLKSDAELRKVYALFAMNNGSLVKTGSGPDESCPEVEPAGTKFLIKHSIFERFAAVKPLPNAAP
jgi:proline dehydrogenase